MKRFLSFILALALCFGLCGCVRIDFDYDAVKNDAKQDIYLGEVPEYSGDPYIIIEGNKPNFNSDDIKPIAFESYASLDRLGRCGEAYACIDASLMPTEERGSIGSVKPTGWQTEKYDIVDGKYLYNRCHLIGFQLTGENANKQNLITGTRYMNTEGMLPFENMVADYIKETGNHVLYRVIPVFEGDNLVANGVTMEALSVEDGGEGICFYVYIYNVQPDIVIDYATGKSHLENNTSSNENSQEALTSSFIINKNSKKIHKAECSGVKGIKEENKKVYSGNISPLLNQGYTKCKSCFD